MVVDNNSINTRVELSRFMEKKEDMITSLYEKRMVKADLSQKKEKGRNLSQNNTE